MHSNFDIVSAQIKRQYSTISLAAGQAVCDLRSPSKQPSWMGDVLSLPGGGGEKRVTNYFMLGSPNPLSTFGICTWRMECRRVDSFSVCWFICLGVRVRVPSVSLSSVTWQNSRTILHDVWTRQDGAGRQPLTPTSASQTDMPSSVRDGQGSRNPCYLFAEVASLSLSRQTTFHTRANEFCHNFWSMPRPEPLSPLPLPPPVSKSQWHVWRGLFYSSCWPSVWTIGICVQLRCCTRCPMVWDRRPFPYDTTAHSHFPSVGSEDSAAALSWQCCALSLSPSLLLFA